MPPSGDPLASFHPAIRRWFEARYGEPTGAQRLGWPLIAAGEHVLLVAPTGSGKTLAAFLGAIDRLATGALPGGAVRVLYVSPLKALGTDVRRNLLGPLEELRAAFAATGREMPEIRVETRSGDTPAEERARMARRPPEILVTTPESLNILLTSRRGRAMLAGVATVILDEVHAVVGSKRGVHLITAVERLTRLAGEVQRVALSATVEPAERVARWVGGCEPGIAGQPGRPRRVAVALSTEPKHYDLLVRFPAGGVAGAAPATNEGLWQALVGAVRTPVGRNRSTLVFANSRRMVEKLTRLVNEDADDELVYSHHGSLSREVRGAVEERLKAGALRGIVATNSLELGIDVGTIDEVLLVQTPPSVAAAVQRIGRAGHGVGETSRARLLPLFPRDLLDAAVMARAVADGRIEPVVPLAGPLDVLAQVIVSMTATETWPIEEVWTTVRCADPYRDLPRRQFDLVLDLLAGRFASARVRHLKPLVGVDLVDGTVRGRPGAERLVYLAGGTIPDRGYFHLRREDSGALLGELDEEFVWERSVGDTFSLGVQTWRIERITHNDVFVRPARAFSAMAPFWRAEERSRSFAQAERVGAFLEDVEPRLNDADEPRRLAASHLLEAGAAETLVDLLRRQRAATGRLPHRHRILAEHVRDPQERGGDGDQLIVHTLWGGQVNRPLALALQAAWEEAGRGPLEVVADDDCLLVAGGGEVSATELLRSVTSGSLERLLRHRLERSGLFGARFREAAGCALVLPRQGFHRRTPLWLSRQRAKELLEAVSGFDDFPLVLEAWRACLADEFDLEALRRLLDELHDGVVELLEVRTDAPSPFAAGAVWKRTNELMYEDDAPATGATRLRADLIREVARSSHLRPRVRPALAETLRRKLQRTWPGWSPAMPRDLLDWTVERRLIPVAEWDELVSAVERDHGVADPLAEIAGKLALVVPPGREEPAFVAAIQELPALFAALGVERSAVGLRPLAAGTRPAQVLASLPPAAVPDLEAGDPLAELVATLLRFEGPVPHGFVSDVLAADEARIDAALEELADAQRIIAGELVEGGGIAVADAENLERLLRAHRAAARPEVEALPASALPAFLADWQGVGGAGDGIDGLQAALERLFGVVLPAGLWETDVLPARLDPYVPGWLDALLADGELVWFGCGKEKVAFSLASDRELFVGGVATAGEDPLPEGPGRYVFEELAARLGTPSAELAKRLWQAAWSGRVSATSFAPLRRGLEAGFEPAEPAAAAGAGRRRLRFERWRGSRPFAGAWFRLPAVEAEPDPLEAAALERDRARVLLERHGVVFRELVERELPALAWGRVFRALRLMELAGEVVSGQFFDGVAGSQFALPAALARLREGAHADRLWWLCAADPASPCGLAVEGLPDGLPRRVRTSHLAFEGSRLVAVSNRLGRDLDLRVAPDHPRLREILGFLRVALTRAVRPVRSVTVETINGAAAADSPYRAALAGLFHVTRDGTRLRLMRRY